MQILLECLHFLPLSPTNFRLSPPLKWLGFLNSSSHSGGKGHVYHFPSFAPVVYFILFYFFFLFTFFLLFCIRLATQHFSLPQFYRISSVPLTSVAQVIVVLLFLFLSTLTWLTLSSAFYDMNQARSPGWLV